MLGIRARKSKTVSVFDIAGLSILCQTIYDKRCKKLGLRQDGGGQEVDGVGLSAQRQNRTAGDDGFETGTIKATSAQLDVEPSWSHFALIHVRIHVRVFGHPQHKANKARVVSSLASVHVEIENCFQSIVVVAIVWVYASIASLKSILHELFCALVLSSSEFLTKAEEKVIEKLKELSRLGTCGVDLSQSKLPLDTDSSTIHGLDILRRSSRDLLSLAPEPGDHSWNVFEFAGTNIANNAMQSEIATFSQSHRKL
ncbi:hypothetical protein IWZ01DRAFT_572152 [Phyllosticta capitalensis]